jgi:microcompartment protein CcmL/EutN
LELRDFDPNSYEYEQLREAGVPSAVAAGIAEAEERGLYITSKIISRQSSEMEWFAHMTATGKDKLR